MLAPKLATKEEEKCTVRHAQRDRYGLLAELGKVAGQIRVLHAVIAKTLLTAAHGCAAVECHGTNAACMNSRLHRSGLFSTRRSSGAKAG